MENGKIGIQTQRFTILDHIKKEYNFQIFYSFEFTRTNSTVPSVVSNWFPTKEEAEKDLKSRMNN